MPDLLAVKRVTASDLTFFESIYRITNVGNQKSINLNADVLTGVLYPRLAAYADAQPDREISFPLTIFGPAAAGAQRVRRKILKGGAYKNWRLNGEFVYDPDDGAGRYDVLRAGDIAVFGFDGLVAPEAVTLVMLARNAPADAILHEALNRLVPGGRKTMIAITSDRIAEAMGLFGVPADHPLSVLVVDGQVNLALEDLAQGGNDGLAVLQRRRRGRPVSIEELVRAKRAAEMTGADGESLVDIYLAGIANPGGGWRHDWVSATNAVSPFDFSCQSIGGQLGDTEFDIDVKSTRGAFETSFHISRGELLYAVQSTKPYYVYRVSELSDDGAWLTTSNDLREFSRALIVAHDAAMPGRVAADSFTVPTDSPGLSWQEPIRVVPPEEGEE